ncbi:Mitochondrial intermembrane space cysteine motif-containing protein MIX23 [Spathaspora sp. JA1]|nr:Mitochondrial intermembrane space cysteine motif-containing protein MIX23 [Spathaspora sp. JA1]
MGVPQPNLLTHESCISSSRIRAFLRVSRNLTDDTIRQHLNEVKSEDCGDYFRNKIGSEWKKRGEVISYCKNYSKELRKSSEKGVNVDTGESEGTFDELNKKFDLRTDPYALRAHQNKMQEQFAQCDALDSWVHNEETVENIIRQQTIEVLNDKCYYQDWMQAFKNLK